MKCNECEFDVSAKKVLYDPEYSSNKVNDCLLEYYDKALDDVICLNFEEQTK